MSISALIVGRARHHFFKLVPLLCWSTLRSCVVNFFSKYCTPFFWSTIFWSTIFFRRNKFLGGAAESIRLLMLGCAPGRGPRRGGDGSGKKNWSERDYTKCRACRRKKVGLSKCLWKAKGRLSLLLIVRSLSVIGGQRVSHAFRTARPLTHARRAPCNLFRLAPQGLSGEAEKISFTYANVPRKPTERRKTTPVCTPRWIAATSTTAVYDRYADLERCKHSSPPPISQRERSLLSRIPALSGEPMEATSGQRRAFAADPLRTRQRVHFSVAKAPRDSGAVVLGSCTARREWA